jgi:hypothetical protein
MEFDRIAGRVEAGEDRDLLDEWYPRDDNAVPPVRYLRPRAGELADYRSWAPIERRLRRLLEAAVAGTGLAADPRFIASATEQEIVRGALEVPDAREHVFGFFRAIEGVPADGRFMDLETGGGVDARAQARLEDLKARLRSALPGHVYDYRVGWRDGRPADDHLEQLAVDVRDALMGVISRQLAGSEEVEPLEQEIRRHREFAAERGSDFTGREGILGQVSRYLDAGGRWPLAIHGASGAGKSALIAKAAADAEREYPGAAVILRFIGHTPGSAGGRELLAGLCREVVRAYGSRPELVGEEQRPLLDESTLPVTYDDLAAEFANRLALGSPRRPLIIFLDALDQLAGDDPARQLSWLPSELPEGVRLVVTTSAPPHEAPPERTEIGLPTDPYSSLRSRWPAGQLLELERMEQSEGSRLLDTWLARAGRTLRPDQRRQVIEKFELEGLPLYLKLAFEQARLWRSDTPPERTELAIGIRGVIRTNLFARLAAEDQHGATLVARSLGYLAAAKNGLSEDELLDVLSGDVEVVADFRRRSPNSPVVDWLPWIVWSRLYFDLEPYLSERAADGAPLLSFYHRQLREVVEEEFLAGDAGPERHRQLAAYFADDRAQPLERHANGAVTANLRRLSELWDDVFDTLTDFQFLEAKAAHGGVIEATDGYGRVSRTYTGVYQLQDDYALALARMPGACASRPRRRIIVTGTDLGDGLELHCPHCNRASEFDQRWCGRDIDCPHCGGPLTVNEFVVDGGTERSG